MTMKMAKKPYTVTGIVTGSIATVPGLSDHFSSYLQKTKTSPFLCVYCMLKTQGDEIDPTIKDMRGIISSLQNKIDCCVPSNTTHNHGSDSPM